MLNAHRKSGAQRRKQNNALNCPFAMYDTQAKWAIYCEIFTKSGLLEWDICRVIRYQFEVFRMLKKKESKRNTFCFDSFGFQAIHFPVSEIQIH